MQRSDSTYRIPWNRPVSLAPLAVFRFLFGAVMFLGTLRFMARGWVTDLYVTPQYFFTYWGFEWVRPLGETGMYAVFVGMAIAFLMVALGWFYRVAIGSAFVLFTYVELIDKTTYLNHYYFVSIVCLLLLLLPAHRMFSVDAWRKPALRLKEIPLWVAAVIPAQLGLVYVFAGIAKLHPDWVLNAMPLRLWLPAMGHLPVVGDLLKETWVAYAFSWFGLVYDLCIPFLLLMRKTRPFAYVAVVVFHLATWLLFPIGMFPWIMMLSTLIFFPASFHLRIIRTMEGWLAKVVAPRPAVNAELRLAAPGLSKVLAGVFVLHFVVQVLMPCRYALYDGDLFWTEQGYRFSWRVMLMEKAGVAFYEVTDPATGATAEVEPGDYLTDFQEKQLCTQPDMLLQFAHFLEDEFRAQGVADPEVRVRSYVTLNGSSSRPFLDASVDLTKWEDGLAAKPWILPIDNETLAMQ